MESALTLSIKVNGKQKIHFESVLKMNWTWIRPQKKCVQNQRWKKSASNPHFTFQKPHLKSMRKGTDFRSGFHVEIFSFKKVGWTYPNLVSPIRGMHRIHRALIWAPHLICGEDHCLAGRCLKDHGWLKWWKLSVSASLTECLISLIHSVWLLRILDYFCRIVLVAKIKYTLYCICVSWWKNTPHTLHRHHMLFILWTGPYISLLNLS